MCACVHHVHVILHQTMVGGLYDADTQVLLFWVQ